MRRDLTHLAAFAIDDEGSDDPDDAISLEGNRLWVHVADVAALVPPESPADLEARARGANLYLPEGTVPMLPPEVTQLLGLGLADISPALSFGMDLTPAGEITGIEIVPSWIRVTRLTYDEVELRLAEEPFTCLYDLALRCEARRQTRGAITLTLTRDQAVSARRPGDSTPPPTTQKPEPSARGHAYGRGSRSPLCSCT